MRRLNRRNSYYETLTLGLGLAGCDLAAAIAASVVATAVGFTFWRVFVH
jgi:hypothetical protein